MTEASQFVDTILVDPEEYLNNHINTSTEIHVPISLPSGQNKNPEPQLILRERTQGRGGWNCVSLKLGFSKKWLSVISFKNLSSKLFKQRIINKRKINDKDTRVYPGSPQNGGLHLVLGYTKIFHYESVEYYKGLLLQVFFRTSPSILQDFS